MDRPAVVGDPDPPTAGCAGAQARRRLIYSARAAGTPRRRWASEGPHDPAGPRSRDDPGRREGVAPRAPDARAQQALRPVRRPLPHRRLRPVELRQLADPLALRPGPVQVTVADRASPDGLADERPGPRPLHRGRPSADADRRDVVPGERGRRAAEPEPGRRLRAGPGRRLRRGPHLPDGREPDGRLPPRPGGRRHGRGAAGPGVRGRGLRGARPSTRPGGSWASSRSRRRRSPCRGTRSIAWCRWGTTSSRAGSSWTRWWPMRRQQTDHDFGKSIIPALVPTARVFAYDFQGERRAGHQALRGAGVLARRGDDRGLLAGPHGPPGRDAPVRPRQPRAGPSTRPATTDRRPGSSGASSRTRRSARGPSCCAPRSATRSSDAACG